MSSLPTKEELKQVQLKKMHTQLKEITELLVAIQVQADEVGLNKEVGDALCETFTPLNKARYQLSIRIK